MTGAGQTCRCDCGYRCGGPGRCRADRLTCIAEHFVRDCDHEFTGWQEGTTAGGAAWGSTACKHCGLTSLEHDMRVGP